MQEHKVTMSNPSSTGKGHSLFAHALHKSTDSWVLDSGASHHTTQCHELFPSRSDSSISEIAVGESKQLNVLGSTIIQLDNSYFNNVLLVPNISTNLLSFYQICHSCDGKMVWESESGRESKELREREGG